MGCVLSKKNINDIHPNIFKVMNVDDSGHRLSPGQLEITDNDLILHQQGKNPTKWPLRCLRRYGFNAELFSFESGRRCATGPGIYAFKCNRAEQLFNLLQAQIQMRNNLTDDNISHDLPLAPPNGSILSPRVNMISDLTYLEPRTLCNFSSRLNLHNWPANGIIGHTALSPPPLPPKHYINGNLLENENTNCFNHTYANVNLSMCSSPTGNGVNNSYINVNLDQIKTDSLKSGEKKPNDLNYLQLDNSKCNQTSDESLNLEHNRVYMNILPGNISPNNVNVCENIINSNNLSNTPHEYVNLESNMIKSQSVSSTTQLNCNEHHAVTTTQSRNNSRQMNYIVLDLDNNTVNSDPNPSPLSLQSITHSFESSKPSEGYATIDFDRTVALSHTVVPNRKNDSEGCRKTRHHSTVAVSEVHLLAFPRMSSSLSD